MSSTNINDAIVVRRLDPGAREERVLHPFDGIREPVEPRRLLEAGMRLHDACGAILATHARATLLGLDAGGILPTVALAIASDIPYRIAWKLNLDLPDRLMFEEPHARRNQVSVYGLTAGQSVLVVDDEVTTGHTVANLYERLSARDIAVVGVACIAEAGDGVARARLAALGVPLVSLYTIR